MKKIVKGEEAEKKLGHKPFNVSASVEGPQHGVVTRGQLEAKDKAGLILTDAEKDADAIRGQAQRLLSQVQSETEKARAKGYAEGKQQGYAEQTEEILKLKQLKEEFYTQAEPEVIRLTMAIAEKVVDQLVQEHREAIVSVVKQALEKSLGDKIIVRINPEDWKRLKTEDIHFGDFLDRTKQVHFKEDPAIQRGGCIVETEVGTIDAQLETQLKAIRKALGV